MARGTMRPAVLAMLAVLAVLAGTAHALCDTYDNTLADGVSLGFCAGVVDYPYYRAAGVSQAQLEGQVVAAVLGANETERASKATLLSLLPSSCSTGVKAAACQAVFQRCQVLPAPFLGNPAPYDATYPVTEANCAQAPQLEWDASTGVCGVSVPKFPCRDQCTSLSSVAGGVCPLVSGLFGLGMGQKKLGGITEAHIISDFDNIVTARCAPGGYANTTCLEEERFTLNLIETLGLAPLCEETAATGLGALDVFPDVTQATLQGAVEGFKSANSLDTDCGPSNDRALYKCADFEAAYACGEAPVAMKSVQRSYDVVDENATCSRVLRSSVSNGNPATQALMHVLAATDAAYQPTANQAACLASGKTDRYQGLFYVPASTGLAPLSSRIDANSNEGDGVAWDTEACPNNFDAGNKFANLANEAEPLCQSATVPGRVGYNSRDCLQIQVDDSYARIPSIAPSRCRAAFEEFLCSQAQMKPELKSLCLVPDALGGCIEDDPTAAMASDQMPFQYALPRFPSHQTCTSFNRECGPLLASIGAELTDCDAPLQITTCTNNNMAVWGCDNSFNGLPAFPVTAQTFATPASLGESLETYLALLNGKSLPIDISSALSTNVMEPTVSAPLYSEVDADAASGLLEEFCNCPSPLVVPENPLTTVPINGSCCALPCLGTMLNEDKMQRFAIIQVLLNGIGIVLASFMVLTWGIFKEKQKQYMTFWMSVCSFNVSLGFLAMVATPDLKLSNNMCFDNATPQVMKIHGFGLAAFQALWLTYWSIALCGWWLMQALDLFRKLVRGTRSTDSSRRLYHAFSWLVPLIPSLYLLITGQLGFNPPTPWAFITQVKKTTWLNPFTGEEQEIYERDGNTVEWAGYYSIIGLCFFSGTAMMCAVIVVIIKHTNRAANLKDGTGSSGRNILKRSRMYRTPVVFVLLFILVWANVFSFRFFTVFQEEEYMDQGEEWVRCLLFNFANGISDPATNPAADTSMLVPAGDYTGCGDLQPGGIPEGSLTLTFTVIMMQSILVFAVFGTNARNYQLWSHKLGCKAGAADTFQEFTDEGSFSKETPQRSYQVGMPGSSYGSSQYAQNNASFYANTPPAPPPGMPPSAPQPYY